MHKMRQHNGELDEDVNVYHQMNGVMGDMEFTTPEERGFPDVDPEMMVMDYESLVPVQQ